MTGLKIKIKTNSIIRAYIYAQILKAIMDKEEELDEEEQEPYVEVRELKEYEKV